VAFLKIKITVPKLVEGVIQLSKRSLLIAGQETNVFKSIIVKYKCYVVGTLLVENKAAAIIEA
jgi:CO dehydrogenase/acetyl-CoA synthase epsilon subunit